MKHDDDDDNDEDDARRALRILCFTWNTQSVRLAECLGTGSRSGSWLDMSYKRYDPDFLPSLTKRIVDSECDLFVCALQESAKPGSHFVSDALPRTLTALGFCLLHRTRLMGVGATTFQQLCREGELMSRGLRLAVYAKTEWFENNTVSIYDNWWHATAFDVVSRGKGATAICMYVRGLGRICFMNCHLPFDARSVAQSNSERVIGCMSEQARSLRSLIARCRAAHAPHYLVLMGDLNFRVLNFSDGVDPTQIWHALTRSEESRRAVYELRDELHAAIAYHALPQLREGKDNCGPCAFMPTGKMRHGRQSGCVDRRAYYFGHGAAQNPSWCDRILYARSDELGFDKRNGEEVEGRVEQDWKSEPCVFEQRNSEGDGTIECIEYDRFEAGQTMTRSDHSAVIGCYEIRYSDAKHFCADNETHEQDIASFIAYDCGVIGNDDHDDLNSSAHGFTARDQVVVEFIDSVRENAAAATTVAATVAAAFAAQTDAERSSSKCIEALDEKSDKGSDSDTFSD